MTTITFTFLFWRVTFSFSGVVRPRNAPHTIDEDLGFERPAFLRRQAE